MADLHGDAEFPNDARQGNSFNIGLSPYGKKLFKSEHGLSKASIMLD